MGEWCTVCNGEGGFEEHDEEYDEMVWEQCSECCGTGYIEEDCPDCGGLGSVEEDEFVDCENCQGGGIV